MKKLVAIFLLLAVIAAGVIAVVLRPDHHKHPLVGCWEARDSTVFIFRDDGTFIGRDYQGWKIFGSWVSLNDFQIGFQSLFHTGHYAPQYAEITRTGMRYAYADSPGFIQCVRTDPETAARRVALASLNQEKQPN